VIFGIVFVIASQATGFVDNLLPTGKAGMYLLNGTCWAFLTALVALLYRQPAGVIAGEVEAITAIFYSPLWIAFVFANALGSLGVSLVAKKFSMEKWSHHILAQFVCNVLGNAVVFVGLIVIYNIPVRVALVEISIVVAFCWPCSTVLTKWAYDALKKSGLVG
jgi:hypothetical protein